MNVADAILRTLESPNVPDSNFGPANVVDVIDRLASCMVRIARAVTPDDTLLWTDANGDRVGSLTESVMGVTGSLSRIADSISELAEAVRSVAESAGKASLAVQAERIGNS